MDSILTMKNEVKFFAQLPGSPKRGSILKPVEKVLVGVVLKSNKLSKSTALCRPNCLLDAIGTTWGESSTDCFLLAITILTSQSISIVSGARTSL